MPTQPSSLPSNDYPTEFSPVQCLFSFGRAYKRDARQTDQTPSHRPRAREQAKHPGRQNNAVKAKGQGGNGPRTRITNTPASQSASRENHTSQPHRLSNLTEGQTEEGQETEEKSSIKGTQQLSPPPYTPGPLLDTSMADHRCPPVQDTVAKTTSRP